MYYYLTHTLILGLVWLLLYWYRKDLRHEILVSSLLFMPFGIGQPFFVPEYFNPPVLYKFFGLFDIESFLWCFFIGGIAAVIYEEIFSYHLNKNQAKRKDKISQHHAYIIYSMLIVLVAAMTAIHIFTDLSVLRISYLLVLPIIAYMLITRHDLIKESFSSGFIMMLLYILTLKFLNLF